MADRLKGIVIELGADTTQLTKALSGVNSSLKSTQSELNDVNRLLKLDPTNTELLTQKQRLLSSQSQETARKLDTLKDAQTQLQKKLKDGADATEDERKQMDRLAREIVATSFQMERLADETKKTNSALEEGKDAQTQLQKKLKDGADATEDEREQMDRLAREIVATSSQMERLADETKKTNSALEEGQEKTSLVGNAVGALADKLKDRLPSGLQDFAAKLGNVNTAGLALAETIGGITVALGKMTLSTAESAKQINIMSQRMGMTVQEYQEWDYVLERVGSSAEDAQGDLAALAEKAKEAAAGSGEAAELFEELGVKVKNTRGQLKSQNELFSEVVTALQGMTDATERNAIASALLSTTGENLVPILNMTKEELAGIKQQARDTGAVMDEETIGKFQKLSDSMTIFTQTTETVKNNLALALLPILTRLFEVIASMSPETLSMIIQIGSVVTIVIMAVKAVKELSDGIGGLGKGIKDAKEWFDSLNPTLVKTVAIISAIVAAIIMVLALIALIKGQNLKDLGNIGVSQSQIQSNLTSNLPRYATGTQYHRGGWAMVGENGPEAALLPQGTRVLTASQTNRALSGGDTFYVTIDAKNLREFEDVVRMAQNARQQRRAR